MLRYLYTFTISFLASLCAYAQVNLGIGGEIGFPLMFNRTVGDYHHSLASPGLRATVSYTPQEATFVPSATFSLSSIHLPIERLSSDNFLFMTFAAYTVTLNGRLRKQFDKKELLYGLGVGVTYLNGTGVGASGRNSSSFQFRDFVADSSEFITMVLPAININAEYIFPISSQVPLYAGIGGQLQYSYFYNRGREYKMGIIDMNGSYYALQPRLYGHMINPILFLNIYYKFGNRNDGYY
ncbi:MAG: hypothetical protein EOP56_14590 [Sphingobacteriales bacterium]|nr:MAG: hypothetical protein EOP56_14590 [Sphingobacteriales bacterium]